MAPTDPSYSSDGTQLAYFHWTMDDNFVQSSSTLIVDATSGDVLQELPGAYGAVLQP